jgi:hypothetical protein
VLLDGHQVPIVTGIETAALGDGVVLDAQCRRARPGHGLNHVEGLHGIAVTGVEIDHNRQVHGPANAPHHI